MANESIFCSFVKIPGIEQCMLMSEWAAHWQSFGVVVALSLAVGGGFKVLHEISQIKKRKNSEDELRRIEFFLAQHRRLFDNVELFSVLGHLDGDHVDLSKTDFWDKNRKFLTFIEEIELLVRSGKIGSDVACNMFGYYAICARDGKNFNVGIKASREHWALFNDFCDRHEKFKERNPNGANGDMKL